MIIIIIPNTFRRWWDFISIIIYVTPPLSDMDYSSLLYFVVHITRWIVLPHYDPRGPPSTCTNLSPPCFLVSKVHVDLSHGAYVRGREKRISERELLTEKEMEVSKQQGVTVLLHFYSVFTSWWWQGVQYRKTTGKRSSSVTGIDPGSRMANRHRRWPCLRIPPSDEQTTRGEK